MTVRMNAFLSAVLQMDDFIVKSVESAKTLNKDCALVEAEELDMNLKQFLAHIGKLNLKARYQDYN